MKRIGIIVLVWSAVLIGGTTAKADAELPPQPTGLEWPTRAWQSTDLPADVDKAALDLAIAQAFSESKSLLGQTRGLLIVQGGRIVFERYGEGFSQDMPLVSWSVAKSITHALVGAAVLQGRLSIDDALGSPYWKAGDPRASIPWRIWLTMTDGSDYRENGANIAEAGPTRMVYGEGRDNIARWSAERKLIHKPGEHWNYSSAGTVLMADALTRLVVPDPADADDRRRRMRAWMQQSLFGPLGMNPVVEFDPQGTFYGNNTIYATARDFARFGYLYLRNGVWDGKRILPEGWVDFARSRGPDRSVDVYGAQWWITPSVGTGVPERALITDTRMSDAFYAKGYQGQIIAVVPSKDIVLVRLGIFEDSPEKWNALGDWVTHLLTAFPDRKAAVRQ